MTIWEIRILPQYPDLYSLLQPCGCPHYLDQSWYEGEFIPVVQQRGAAIIKARELHPLRQPFVLLLIISA